MKYIQCTLWCISYDDEDGLLPTMMLMMHSLLWCTVWMWFDKHIYSPSSMWNSQSILFLIEVLWSTYIHTVKYEQWWWWLGKHSTQQYIYWCMSGESTFYSSIFVCTRSVKLYDVNTCCVDDAKPTRLMHTAWYYCTVGCVRSTYTIMKHTVANIQFVQ